MDKAIRLKGRTGETIGRLDNIEEQIKNINTDEELEEIAEEIETVADIQKEIYDSIQFDNQIILKEEKWEEKLTEIDQKDQEIDSLDSELQDKKKRVKRREREISKLEDRVDKLTDEIDEIENFDRPIPDVTKYE